MSEATPSHVDAFGRLSVSRADYVRLSAMWNAEHGMPRNDMDLIVRDQWVTRRSWAEQNAVTPCRGHKINQYTDALEFCEGECFVTTWREKAEA